jgi:hypothetical protein
VKDVHSTAAEILKTGLQPSSECLDADRLEGPLSTRESAHVDECPRCRTQVALYREFMDSTPTPDEGAAVSWITHELRRRATATGRPSAAAAIGGWWAGLFRYRAAFAAAAVILVASVGYLALDREPALREPTPGTGAYRQLEIPVRGPVGELQAPPPTFEWQTVSGAVRYDVVLLEVDGTPVWNASVTATRVATPPSIEARMVPGKTLRWKVVARDAAGVAIAETQTHEFRVIF